MNNIQKYQKNESVKSKLERLTKEAKKEENKNWARKLADDFWALILFCISDFNLAQFIGLFYFYNFKQINNSSVYNKS